MAILKIARLGHPVLRKKAAPLAARDVASPAIQRLIDDMIATMREYQGVGLAAPQVHESVRLAVYEVAASDDGPRGARIPLTVLINPVLTPLSDDLEEDWEGCLSLPDLRGRVPRHTKLRVEAWDREGKKRSFVAKEFHARVIQHECDHLEGTVFLDRMRDLASLAFLPEFLRYSGVDGDVRD